MARKQNTYVCQVKEVVSSEWTKIGAGFQNKVEGETPNTENGYTIAVTAKTLKGIFQFPEIPNTEIPIKVELFVYGMAGSAALDAELHADSITLNLTTTTPEWHHSAITAEEGTVFAELEAFTLKTLKGAGATVYAVYAVLTTETERDYTSGTLSRPAFSTAGAEGVYENTGLGAMPAGKTSLVFLTVAGEHGASSVTDTKGNTWTLDGEAKHGANVTVQVWSSLIGTAVGSEEKITASGLPPSAKINFALINTLSALQATSKVDVSVSGEATGTELALESAATRAGQGDFAILHYGIDQEATFTATGFTAAPGAPKQAGLTMNPGFVNTPPEGEALKVSGKYNTSGNIAAVLVSYKVLASEGGSATFLKASGTVNVTGSAKLTTVVPLRAAGAVNVAGSARLSTTVPLKPSGAVKVVGSAKLTTVAFLSSAGAVRVTGSARLTTVAGLRPAGVVRVTGSAAIHAAIALRAVGVVHVVGSARISSTVPHETRVFYLTVGLPAPLPLSVQLPAPLPMDVQLPAPLPIEVEVEFP